MLFVLGILCLKWLHYKRFLWMYNFDKWKANQCVDNARYSMHTSVCVFSLKNIPYATLPTSSKSHATACGPCLSLFISINLRFTKHVKHKNRLMKSEPWNLNKMNTAAKSCWVFIPLCEQSCELVFFFLWNALKIFTFWTKTFILLPCAIKCEKGRGRYLVCIKKA